MRKTFIRVTQRLVKLLSEVTATGYVFRVDLRLRPDPSVTPVCIASDPAEHYYESVGRTWERAAYIKARPCAGAIAAGEAFLARLRPFIWRRHLDFAAIEDAQDIRKRIRAHKGLAGPLRLAGHDIKLGQGGIRDIEFFTQTRQLIVGGRDEGLRQRGTLAALAALADKGWVDRDAAATLTDAYTAHRELEHRLQMLEDAQTQRLPDSPAEMARLADFCGKDAARVRGRDHRAARDRRTPSPSPSSSRTPAPPTRRRPEAVFADPAAAEATMAAWRRLPALRSERARGIFRRLEPELVRRIAGAASPDEALVSLDAFLSRLPAGRADLLADAGQPLASRPPHRHLRQRARQLARHLGANAGVLDAVISADFYRPLRGAVRAPRRARRAPRARPPTTRRRSTSPASGCASATSASASTSCAASPSPRPPPPPTPPSPRPSSARSGPSSPPTSPPATARRPAPAPSSSPWASSAAAR